MNNDNLKNGRKFRSDDEATRTAGRNGGIASGISRNLKGALKRRIKDDPDVLDDVVDSLIRQAKNGDVKAVEVIADLNGESVRREELAFKKKLSREEKSSGKAAAVYSGIPAALVAPAFSPVLFDIADHAHTEYVFPGGRGSTKSTFASLSIIDLIMTVETMHALALRQYSNTLKDSVYSQFLWAISALGLDGEFDFTKSPLEITRKRTGQKIYFRGADDPNKIKSIKPEFGYIGVLWFEELDQFCGADEVRKIEQSAIRGGDTAFIFKTFNPPRSALNWANQYIKIPKDTRLVTMSDYLSVPKKWLGKPFLEEAEFLRETNPDAYENEYLGKANGSGGNVFENVTVRTITDEEISRFDNIFSGVDWGYYPDKFAFVRTHYDSARHTLYIWQEYTANKKSNRQTADKLLELGLTGSDLVTCDSAEPKSVGDYRSFGLCARPAEKGPDSRSYSYKWLQSLREIVIDNERCPVSAQEFLGKEYDRDREGNIISGYPDGNDHCIDAVRYATERKWKKRGQ